MNYDARRVTLVVNDFTVTGFAEGSMITTEAADDRSVTAVSAKGDVARAKKNNPTGTITVRLHQTEVENNRLFMQWALADEEVSIWVYSDNDVKEKIGGTRAWIKKLPSTDFGGEIAAREYLFEVADYVHVIE